VIVRYDSVLCGHGTRLGVSVRAWTGGSKRSATHEEPGQQVPCEVVYHEPPHSPNVLWQAQTQVGFCESRPEELVRALERSACPATRSRIRRRSTPAERRRAWLGRTTNPRYMNPSARVSGELEAIEAGNIFLRLQIVQTEEVACCPSVTAPPRSC
jgi:hypothetical protein